MRRPTLYRLLIAIFLLFACRFPPGRSALAPTASPPPASVITPIPQPTMVIEAAESTPLAVNEPPLRLTRYEIDPAKHPLAVCNDGSTPVFYYRRGSGDGANKWVFWFKGGGGCMDAQSCAGRDHELTSSVGLPQSKDGEGILSRLPAQNPDFYNWNHVLMHYCTSDSWSGASEDNNNEMNWYFRGYYVVNAIVDAAMDENIVGSPTLREATHVLFAGSSAGAHGLYHNIDRLAQMLPWADVRGVADAGLGFAVNPELFAAFEQGKKSQWEIWSPILDESCLATNSSAPESCLETHLLVNGNYITTPVFMRADLFDPLALENNQLDPRDSADRPLILTFAETIAEILKRQSGAFGTAARQHVMIETSEFNSYQVEGLTFAQVLGNWYFNRSGPTVVVETPSR